MKLNKIIILAILSLLIISQISAKRVKNNSDKKQKEKGVFDRLFGEWNKAIIKVDGIQTYEFQCKIKDVFFDQQLTQPFGLMFDGFEQLRDKDKTGFMNYVILITEILGQDFQKPVLDYRYIQNCQFTDNQNEWKLFGLVNDWKLTFNVYGNEEYGLKAPLNKMFGNTWKVEMRLPSLGKTQTQNLKTKLRTLCTGRNKQMNELKDDAIKAGNDYVAAKSLYEKRKPSLNEQSLMGVETQTIIENVRQEQIKIQQSLKVEIEMSETLLQQTTEKFTAASKISQCTNSSIEQFNNELLNVTGLMRQLETKQTIIKKNLDESQQQLNEALLLQQQKLSIQQNITMTKQEEEQKQLTEKQEYDRLYQETQERLQRLQAEYAKKKQQSEQKLQQINQQQVQVGQAVVNVNTSIISLRAQIKEQQEQMKQIEVQTSATKQSIEVIQEKINEKRDVASQILTQQQQLQQIIIQQQREIETYQNETQRKIIVLKEQEIKSIQILKIDEEKRKQLIKDAEQASKDLQTSKQKFEESLAKIVRYARPANVRTTNALKLVETGQFLQEISAIVSSSLQSINASKLRFEKIQKSLERLAQVRAQQIKTVRMSKNKLKKLIAKK